MRVGFRVSERRACQVIGMHRTRYRSRSPAQDQTPLRQRIREIAAVRVRSGYRRVHTVLRRQGAAPSVGTGAFAALLVEWKLAQSAQKVRDTDADQPTLKSA